MVQKNSIYNLTAQIWLTRNEAISLRDGLTKLLKKKDNNWLHLCIESSKVFKAAIHLNGKLLDDKKRNLK